MKTYKNLYRQICAWETLETAYRKARRGNSAGRLAGEPDSVCQAEVEGRSLSTARGGEASPTAQNDGRFRSPGEYTRATPPLVA